MSGRDAQIRSLQRQRRRNYFVRLSVALLATLMIGSWFLGDFQLDDFLSGRRIQNLNRFVGELEPYPVQGKNFDVETVLGWGAAVLSEKGWSASLATLAISIAAIVLAILGGTFFSLPAARNLACPEPFLAALRKPNWPRRLYWNCLVGVTRFILIIARAIPEYLWAFLFLALLGPTAWAAVLALGLHNLGILGKLGGEVVEEVERSTLAGLRGLGASRSQIVFTAIFPLTFPRLLLYFFYRWETCVREATVLGLLGIASLGYWIQDARARNHYDEMFFLILLGVGLVMIGDLLSAVAREVVRKAN